MNKFFLSLCLFLLGGCAGNMKEKNNLPAGFVYLSEVDSTIIQDLRYATKNNFTGKIVRGYESAKLVCTKEAAEALKKVQKDMAKEGYSLVIYDGYRPQRASDYFLSWSKNSDESTKSLYYPSLAKKDLFKYGYVAERSSHSRGSTFDLTYTKNSKISDIRVTKRKLENGEIVPFLDDSTVDMGASFDFFHIVSNHDTNLITKKQEERRNFLRNLMKKHGFKEYDKEWWHYTLDNEPYPDKYFDFLPK